ncbi:hypothetical protein SPF06_21455 [Sinomonas sp. JGH33]|uniref:Uncharacterized protein n=1 Tax=Sinomonas terricola TaxID=3110330 RepID=A0ABU5TC71_9MICC|nr:hypothetical protein [Sinomonas sp. JGH33]MEA5457292.1 hypothetical protein [Sinomonas sp. JGH33]
MAENKLSPLGGLKRRAQLRPESSGAAEPAPVAADRPREEPAPAAEPAPSAVQLAAVPDPVEPNAPTVGEEQHTGNITLRIPTDLMRWLEAHHRESKVSYPNILLNAVSWAHPRMAELFAQTESPVPEGDLFGRPATIPTLRRGEAEYDTKAMKLRPEHLAVIDGLAAKWTHKNRTQLLTVSLKAYRDSLPG